MKIRQRSSSFYFLGELLFVILCFALGSVLCVRLFALADQKHQLALDQNQALRLAQPLAETAALCFQYAIGSAVSRTLHREVLYVAE
ncbi:MAG: hypothetical protein ACLSA6_15655 [Holdemania massiliensis]